MRLIAEITAVPAFALALAMAGMGVLPGAESPTPTTAPATPTLRPSPVTAAGRPSVPTAVPTNPPTAIPPKPEPSPVPFFAPLSLRKCLDLLDRVDSFTPAPPATRFEPTTPTYSMKRMVQSVYNYLEFRDDLHTSLAAYSWTFMGRGKVEHNPTEVDTDTYKFEPSVKRISALSFEVQNADAYLHRVQVFDEKGLLRETFTRNPATRLQHSLPRREVFHIWRRTTISRIDIAYSKVADNDPTPVVIIRGGITEEPEHIKTAMYWLRKAQTAIDDNDPVATRAALEEARRFIQTQALRSQRE